MYARIKFFWSGAACNDELQGWVKRQRMGATRWGTDCGMHGRWHIINSSSFNFVARKRWCIRGGAHGGYVYEPAGAKGHTVLQALCRGHWASRALGNAGLRIMLEVARQTTHAERGTKAK